KIASCTRRSSAAWAPPLRPTGRSRWCAGWRPTRERLSWRPTSAPPRRWCWPGSPPAARRRPRAPIPSIAATKAWGSSCRPSPRASRGSGASVPPLTVALPKGRLLDPALQLLSSIGIKGLEADTRRLLLTDAERDVRVIFLKPADIPTYVEYGAADL